ncbi:MAG: hypothetical protein OXU79_21210 [Gemmatimonadota bacterium]|nr:hypothetical protein [Gemmatimonadota bacterium]
MERPAAATLADRGFPKRRRGANVGPPPGGSRTAGAGQRPRSVGQQRNRSGAGPRSRSSHTVPEIEEIRPDWRCLNLGRC